MKSPTRSIDWGSAIPKFVDTSALVSYYTAASDQRARVRDALDGEPTFSSEHVIREWRRLVAEAGDTILTAALQEPDLSTFYGRLQRRAFGRDASKRLALMAALVLPGETGTTIEDVIIQARSMLRGHHRTYEDRVIDEVRSRSSCPLAVGQIREENGSWKFDFMCRKSEDICGRIDHVENQLTRWDAGADALIESGVDSFLKMGRTAKEFHDDPRSAKGRNCWGSTGDLSIALDCEDEQLVTTDKIFGALGPAMGFEAQIVSDATSGDSE